MPIPKNVIVKEHILKALAAVDQNGVPWHRQSTKFDLIYNDKKYPPKYAVSLAFGIATGKELHGFTGGEETNGFLKSFGLEIKGKTEGTYLVRTLYGGLPAHLFILVFQGGCYETNAQRIARRTAPWDTAGDSGTLGVDRVYSLPVYPLPGAL
jgi:hypothetical protein